MATGPATTLPAPPRHVNGHAIAARREPLPTVFPLMQYQFIPADYLPNGSKSLPGISMRAYCLGIAFGIGLLSSVQLAYFGYGLWRVPFFLATLATFHYLEFHMTARFNPPDGGTASFLLTGNGTPYAVAHISATLEVLLRFASRSQYWPELLTLPSSIRMANVFPTIPSQYIVLLGLLLVVVGQVVRSLAMAHARTNFNHLVQKIKKTDHVLVTDGVYSILRHPSYFGFFWWGLGTQLVLGNHLCFLAYFAALWNFFYHRIILEEKHLIDFFGSNYVAYRERVGVWIPFIH